MKDEINLETMKKLVNFMETLNNVDEDINNVEMTLAKNVKAVFFRDFKTKEWNIVFKDRGVSDSPFGL